MLTLFSDLFVNSSHFMPHGSCFLWLPSILWLHVISDALIALAYFSIPFALWYFVHKRTYLVYRWVFIFFGTFIVLCGITHLMGVWTIWYPDYWLAGVIKAATAITSIVTAVLIWPLIPKLLALPSPQTLETSETYIRAIFNATPDALLISNEQGIITMANQQVEHLLGYTTNELVGLSIEVLVPERFREAHPALRKAFAASAANRMMDKRIALALHKEGHELDVEITLSPIHTAQGLFFASALRDITERKHIDAALRLSEERFRRMANTSPVMMWITDTVGNPTFVNQSWLDFTGIDLTQATTHKGWMDTIYPDDRGTAFLAYYQGTNFHESVTTEYRLFDAKGEVRWILDKGEPLYDNKGVFTGYMGSAIDITERKQMELDMRIAAIAFESQESMVITDAANVILRINKAFTETTGYTEQEAIGQKMSILKSGRHDASFYTAMWKIIEQDGVWQGEIWDRRKNGEVYPKWLSITAVKGSDGIVTHYVGTHDDITARKASDEQIKLLAFYDPLTKLPNRRLLQERLRGCEKINHRQPHLQ